MAAYRTEIQNVLDEKNLNTDPRHVEAFMRVEHPTLDHLSPERFRAEVDLSIACVVEAGEDDAEDLAASLGL